MKLKTNKTSIKRSRTKIKKKKRIRKEVKIPITKRVKLLFSREERKKK
jgi:hypothetical protein